MQQLFPDSFETLTELVRVELAEKGRLEAWLADNGYQDVLDRVRRAKDPAAYTTAVLQAMDRRGLINADFYTKLVDLDEGAHRASVVRLAADMGVHIGSAQRLDVNQAPDVPPIPDAGDPGLAAGGPPPAALDDGLEAIPEPPVATERDAAEPKLAGTPAGGRVDFRRHELQAVFSASRSVVQLTDLQGLGVATGVIVADRVVAVPDYIAELYGDDDGGVAAVRVETDEGPVREPIVDVIAVDSTRRLGLFELAEPVGPPIPTSLRVPEPGELLSILHFPLGGTMRIGPAQAVVVRARDDELAFSANTVPGSAGAALIDAAGRLVGVNHSRTKHFSSGVPSGQIDDLLRAHLGATSVRSENRTVAVDPLTEAAFEDDADQVTSVLIELAAPSIELPSFEGVTIASKWGSTVTAMVNQAGFEQLRESDDVLSIEASRPSGDLELFDSVAMIHATPPEVHDEDGSATLIAVIDNGLDVAHDCFRDGSGASRVVAYWDQVDPAHPGTGYSDESSQLAAELALPYGRLYCSTDLDLIIGGAASDLPAPEDCLHGTAVTSIAAGAPCDGPPLPFPGGVSPRSPLLIVRYAPGSTTPGYEDGHSAALAFIDAMAERLAAPVVVNISNGTHAGAHDGFNSLEVACTQFSQKPGRVVVKSAGNDGDTGRHRRVTASRSVEKLRVEVPDEDGPDHIELWWPASIRAEVSITRPDDVVHGPVNLDFGELRENLPGGGLITALLKPRRTRGDQARAQLTIDLVPGAGRRIPSGEWVISVTTNNLVPDRMVRAWIDSPNRSTRFRPADPDGTVTIPGTAFPVITVGAAQTLDPLDVLDISSAGDKDLPEMKPDLVAPGHEIRAASGGSGNQADANGGEGTSFAAPHVTGTIALALSKAKKAGVDPLPSLREIKFALRDSTPEEFAVWESRRGYGPLHTAAFLDLLDQTIAGR